MKDHVKTSVPLDSAPAWTDRSPDSGSSTPASFARYDPASSSWRTSQTSLFGGLTEYSERLPNSGTMRSGRLYRLPKWEPRTFVADSLSSAGYPTPSASHCGTNQAGSAAHPRPHQEARLSLESMAARNMWPTVTASDAKSVKSHGGRGNPSLTAKVKWSTPTTQDGENNGAPSQHERNSLPLNAQAGGALNPEWVELLMGFCPGHTEEKTPSDGSEG